MNKIILFRTARDVIKADKLCHENGFTVTVRPVPVRIASQCGMCIEIDDQQSSAILQMLASNNIENKIYE